MRFHSLSFYGRRGWKWERPLKAASVSYQTGATSRHPGLFSYPFDLPRSLVWPEWGTALFLELFRDGLWGCCFTLHRHKVYSVHCPPRHSIGMSSPTPCLTPAGCPMLLEEELGWLDCAQELQRKQLLSAGADACALQSPGKVGCLTMCWPCLCFSSRLSPSPLKIVFPHRPCQNG